VKKFEVGDTVEWCGCIGKIKFISRHPISHPILVCFDDDPLAYKAISFTADGKFLSWHASPSLKLVDIHIKTSITMCTFVAKSPNGLIEIPACELWGHTYNYRIVRPHKYVRVPTKDYEVPIET
jgi:hypothetical protein